jgi:hypothetical protein
MSKDYLDSLYELLKCRRKPLRNAAGQSYSYWFEVMKNPGNEAKGNMR